MGLREQAALDLATILQDRDGGFGWDITITDPQLNEVALVGFSTDIGQSIDPETGMSIAGRVASVAVRLATLEAAGMKIPKNIPSRDCRPWVVKFDDIDGQAYTFKVSHHLPDRALGLVVCFLEHYKQ